MSSPRSFVIHSPSVCGSPDSPHGARSTCRAIAALLTTLTLVASTGCSSGLRVGSVDDTVGPVDPDRPLLVVLGTAQDAGSPQVNSPADHPARQHPQLRRFATSLGVIDPATDGKWLFEATPDFREQAWLLSQLAVDSRLTSDAASPANGTPDVTPDGIFLTHAHIGHYTGLMFLGHESMGARRVPVHAAPRMAEFLRTNGPWGQLVRYENIDVQPLTVGGPIALTDTVSATAFLVPHRQEYSEVVGFRIDGPERSALFIPDIDSWDEWAESGTDIVDLVQTVDIAFLDATFHDDNEIPGRDMSTFPHPRIVETMDRLDHLPAAVRDRVHFIHLNHTNPAQWMGTPEREAIERRGFNVAARGYRFSL
ncbi:MAG: MBL fold metallo-hydrolase [Phycisphaerales bacterium]